LTAVESFLGSFCALYAQDTGTGTGTGTGTEKGMVERLGEHLAGLYGKAGPPPVPKPAPAPAPAPG
jgi:hypothetical protein